MRKTCGSGASLSCKDLGLTTERDMVHSKALLSRASGRLGGVVTNHFRAIGCLDWCSVYNSLFSSPCRNFASASKKGSDKKKAMKRQLQNVPLSPDTTTSSSSSSFSSRTISPSNFAAAMNPSDTILSSSRIVPPSSITPIQAEPISHWETDKYRRQYQLSSLPDDAAALLDKEELFDPSIHLPYAPKDWTGYEPATPLSDFLMSRIGVAGRAITIAEYMRHALTHPHYGYYTTKHRSSPHSNKNSPQDDFEDDPWDDTPTTTSTTASTSNNPSTLIGPRGDFITAPEVSHVFGHCLCVWFVTQWQSTLLHRPPKIQLVELGPGRGTLMVDILQLATSTKLEDFGQAITVVHLIETSQFLRKEQEQALRQALGQIIDFEFVHVESSFSTSRTNSNINTSSPQPLQSTQSESDAATAKKFQIRVEWHDTFASFQNTRNRDIPVFMILQEFLDALPVHCFQKTNEGWRERLIDVASVEDDTPPPPTTTTATTTAALRPRLRQVLAPDVTPAVELFLDPNPHFRDAPEGTVVEICPEALMLMDDMAKVLEESQGVALIIDYGQDGTTDSIRAFSNHQQVPLTSYPGQVDVTADVDFFALRSAIAQRATHPSTGTTSSTPSRTIHAFGPIPQGEFLMRMGIADMVINSIEQDDTTPEQAQRLTEALKFLVLPEHMGEKFKVLALAPKRDGIFAPAGMEN